MGKEGKEAGMEGGEEGKKENYWGKSGSKTSKAQHPEKAQMSALPDSLYFFPALHTLGKEPLLTSLY